MIEMFDKITTARIDDDSEYYQIWVQGLGPSSSGDRELPPKLSIEIRHIDNLHDIRSFRTTSKVKMEDFIAAVMKAYGFVLAQKGLFGDGIDQFIVKQNLESKVRAVTEKLFQKLFASMLEGIQAAEELINEKNKI